MKITKSLLYILFSLFTTINFAQNIPQLDCENGFEKIETEIKSQKIVSYKILSSKKLYAEESFEFNQGILVIPNLNNQLTTKEIINIIGRISVKNNFGKALVFKTCKAVQLYFQNEKLTPKQTNYLKENLLPSMQIDLNKSLSKKQRKKNKKKRDFIESIGIEICEVLSKNKIENFSSEKLSNAMIPQLSDNVEKMMKVYDLSFELSSDLFMKDLTQYLVDNCKIVNEYRNKKK